MCRQRQPSSQSVNPNNGRQYTSLNYPLASFDNEFLFSLVHSVYNKRYKKEDGVPRPQISLKLPANLDDNLAYHLAFSKTAVMWSDADDEILIEASQKWDHIAQEQPSPAGVPSEQQSTAYVLPEQQRISDVLPGKQSTAGVLPEEQITTGLSPEQQSSACVLPEQQNVSPEQQIPKQQSISGVLPEQQSTVGVLPDQQINAGVLLEEQITTCLSPEQQSTACVLPEQQIISGVSPEQQSISGVSPKQQSTAGVLPEQQNTAGVLPEQQSISGLSPEQQSISGVSPEQQSTAGVLQEQQSTAGVLQEQQSTAGVLQEQQSTAGLLPEQQNTAGLLQEQQSTKGVLQEQQTTAGLLPKQQNTAGLLPEQQSISGLSPEQQSISGVSPEQQSTAGVLQEQQSTAGVLQEQQSTAGVLQEQQSTAGLLPEQQNTAGLLQEQQSTEGVLQEQQTTAGLLPKQQNTAGLLPEQQNTAGVLLEQQSISDVSLEQQSVAGVSPEQQSTAGVLPEQQSVAGVSPEQQSTACVLPEQQSTAGVLLEQQNTAGVLPEQQSMSKKRKNRKRRPTRTKLIYISTDSDDDVPLSVYAKKCRINCDSGSDEMFVPNSKDVNSTDSEYSSNLSESSKRIYMAEKRFKKEWNKDTKHSEKAKLATTSKKTKLKTKRKRSNSDSAIHDAVRLSFQEEVLRTTLIAANEGRVDQILNTEGYERIQVPPHGNCFFEAACVSNLIPESPSQLRKALYKHLEDNILEYMGFLINKHAPESQEEFVCEYLSEIEHLKEDGYWSNRVADLLPLALTNYATCTLTLFTSKPDQPKIIIEPNLVGNVDNRNLNLAYISIPSVLEHYDACRVSSSGCQTEMLTATKVVNEQDETHTPVKSQTPKKAAKFVSPVKKHLFRKKKAMPQNWKKNVRKRLRISGEEYIATTGKMVKRKDVKECNCAKCKYKCNSKVSFEQRCAIRDLYYGLTSYERQMDFLCSNVQEKTTKSYVDDTGIKVQKRKQVARSYSFVVNDESIRVCKKFFLSTISISQAIVNQALSKKWSFSRQR
ncbi:LOW QUALITY PROTEIN: SLA1-like protein [Mya arenaria]|uniref:SLA1-like protein n=2 Tax=Mya arenaria TaxID=6604 RepID=A0ABY7G7W4_MYAAR|nr:LOW QUALITY PROTEIN: SLA1-like protein [Mya arenaria]